jgi:hypothetical protein
MSTDLRLPRAPTSHRLYVGNGPAAVVSRHPSSDSSTASAREGAERQLRPSRRDGGHVAVRCDHETTIRATVEYLLSQDYPRPQQEMQTVGW